MAPVATAPTTAAVPAAAAAGRPTKALRSSGPAANGSRLPPLVDLYSGSSGQGNQEEDLVKQICQGLRGSDTLIVPGSVKRSQDVQWAYRKTLPTTILYDEQGLKIYDELVNVPEYYLWNAETSILEEHGEEIALRLFGHQTPETLELLRNARGEEGFKREQRKQHRKDQGDKDAPVFDGLDLSSYQIFGEKWGDFRVGRHNGGVNSEHGLNDTDGGGNAPALDSVIELGAGSLRKTIHLLRGLGKLPGLSQQRPVRYYALDLDKAELVRTLGDLREQLGGERNTAADTWAVADGKVAVNGLWATYDQGLDYIGRGGLKDAQGNEGRRVFMWLGSSIGNFERRDGAEFLKNMCNTAMRAGDKLLIGIDRRNAARDVELAYNDPQGVTERFILHGLKHADKVLSGGRGIIDAGKFAYHDRYNAMEGRHESYYRALEAQTLALPDGSAYQVDEGELIHVERSYKYSERETLDAFDHAGLRVVQRWTSGHAGLPQYDLWLVEKPPFYFQSTRLLTGWRDQLSRGLSIAQAHNSNGSHEFDADGGSSPFSIGGQPKDHSLWGSWGMPSLSEWEASWRSWDTITLTMISRGMLHQKPIDLRHICLFYLGHIPAFVDILLLKVVKDLEPLDPHYNRIFERGIDPHVDDPTQCHDHSEVPQNEEEWPKVEEILAYREKIFGRIAQLYDDFATGKRTLNRHLARCIKMAQEHIDLHQETLLYMLAQSQDTLPPTGFSPPDWATLAKHWDEADERQGGEAARTALLNFKADVVEIGHDDDDTQDHDYVAQKPSSDVRDLNSQLRDPHFGWDNEQPSRRERTGAFGISAAPVNNEQYARFLASVDAKERESLIPSSWIASPTIKGEYNVRTIYGPVPMSVAHLWPVQASGSQIRKYAASVGGRLPTQAELRRFFDAKTSLNCVDRPGSNVGFRNWHPVPPMLPTNGGADEDTARFSSPSSSSNDVPGQSCLGLPGHNGGVWEWTSSTFSAHDGFQPSILYPGYSADFHDGKHDVVLGGSWATTPCVAGRSTVCNTYQREYPYSFIGGRVLFDEQTPTRVVPRRSSSGASSASP